MAAADRAGRAGGIVAGHEDWRLLQALSIYRLLLLALLLTLQQFGTVDQLFEDARPRLFYAACIGYALSALLALLPSVYRRPRLSLQAGGNYLIDVAAMVTLVLATGGVAGGMGILLVPPVIATSLLLSARMAMAAAALATLAMFAEEAASQYPFFFSATEFTAVGVLGLMFFITAGTANAVARRARASEALAQKVGSEFEDLSRLNEMVIDTMQTGVLVVDARDEVRAANHAASRMLLCDATLVGTPLAHWSPGLGEAIARWRAGSAVSAGAIAPLRPGGPELMPRFRRLGTAPDSPVLVLLEDAARLREQAQQIKLAALGRLSASIAHEIRNPLAAITHAGQLLAESPSLPAGDQRLLDIIQRHGQRIDRIVRDVLNLSRGSAADPQVFALSPWLEQVLGNYREAHPQRQPLLRIEQPLMARFDPGHLQQVLFNLLDNAWLHGRRGESAPTVTVSLQALYPRGGALDVLDDGPGVPAETVQHLFEPFFTTTAQGTGLGLYLARELCAYNQANLYHQRPESGSGALFRIAFVAPAAEPAT